MIKIIVDSYEDLIAAKGLVALGCESCKDAMKEGKGNIKACINCSTKQIEYYLKEKK